MATATANTIKSTLASFKICCRKGEWIAKRDYFYRSQAGFDGPMSMAEAIRRALASKGITITITDTADKWHAWPKDSWFEVRFTVAE
jgi:hypothetical protein